jgi:flagellar biosynthesis/type III secretory pathway chaperone
MKAQPLIVILEKLIKLHKSLFQLALEKTEVIKKGDVEALTSLMNNEKRHITAIQAIEKERVKLIATILPQLENPTLKECTTQFAESEQAEIRNLQDQLLSKLSQLKDRNELNQELLEQSLLFVELNLDLLMPNDITNYSKTNEDETPVSKINLFDSKA